MPRIWVDEGFYDHIKVSTIDGKPLDVNLASGISISGVTINNDSTAPVPVEPIGIIDSGNIFSGTLASGEVFTGSGIEASPTYGTVSVCVFSSHNSASSGLRFQASIDNTNWETIEAYTYLATDKLESYSFAPSGRYFRLVYTNGNTATTKTAIFTVLRTGYTKSSSHRIGDTISAEKDAELVKAVLSAQKPNGTFTDINATAGGNLKISVEEVEDPLPIVQGFSIPEHDYIELSYTGNDLTKATYKEGGTWSSGTATYSGGVNVGELQLVYTSGILVKVAKV